MHFEPVDTGGIVRSRNLENLLDLWIQMFDPKQPAFAFDLVATPAVVRPGPPGALAEGARAVFVDHFQHHGFTEADFGGLARLMDLSTARGLVATPPSVSSADATVNVTLKGHKVDKLLLLLEGSCVVHGDEPGVVLGVLRPGQLVGERTFAHLGADRNFASATVECAQSSRFASWFEKALHLHLARRPIKRLKFNGLLSQNFASKGGAGNLEWI